MDNTSDPSTNVTGKTRKDLILVERENKLKEKVKKRELNEEWDRLYNQLSNKKKEFSDLVTEIAIAEPININSKRLGQDTIGFILFSQ